MVAISPAVGSKMNFLGTSFLKRLNSYDAPTAKAPAGGVQQANKASPSHHIRQTSFRKLSTHIPTSKDSPCPVEHSEKKHNDDKQLMPGESENQP